MGEKPRLQTLPGNFANRGSVPRHVMDPETDGVPRGASSDFRTTDRHLKKLGKGL